MKQSAKQITKEPKKQRKSIKINKVQKRTNEPKKRK